MGRSHHEVSKMERDIKNKMRLIREKKEELLALRERNRRREEEHRALVEWNRRRAENLREDGNAIKELHEEILSQTRSIPGSSEEELRKIRAWTVWADLTVEDVLKRAAETSGSGAEPKI